MQLNDVKSVGIKASTIQRQFPEVSVDDIYDIILGNITKPEDLVQEILNASLEYDEYMTKYNKD